MATGAGQSLNLGFWMRLRPLSRFQPVEQAAKLLWQIVLSLECRQRFQNAQIAFRGQFASDVGRQLGCCDFVDASARHGKGPVPSSAKLLPNANGSQIDRPPWQWSASMVKLELTLKYGGLPDRRSGRRKGAASRPAALAPLIFGPRTSISGATSNVSE
ncbi:hypothetical protein [Aminobacter sp. MSH1]|uniref:hypothetical protein n=1 Tax=Aminobacter sp. MSH1 TaxID=374606 RepID=UPI00131F1BDA|nr:hypothetical protein [Aminobacter sp. MSH1]